MVEKVARYRDELERKASEALERWPDAAKVRDTKQRSIRGRSSDVETLAGAELPASQRKRAPHRPVGITEVTFSVRGNGRRALVLLDDDAKKRWPEKLPPAHRLALQELVSKFEAAAESGMASPPLRAAIEQAYVADTGHPLADEWIARTIEIIREAALAKYAIAADKVTRAEEIMLRHKTAGAEMFRRAQFQAGRYGQKLPKFVSAEVLAWMLGRFSPGRGGGRHKSVGDAKLHAWLTKPAQLARDIEASAEKAKSERLARLRIDRTKAMVDGDPTEQEQPTIEKQARALARFVRKNARLRNSKRQPGLSSGPPTVCGPRTQHRPQ